MSIRIPLREQHIIHSPLNGDDLRLLVRREREVQRLTGRITKSRGGQHFLVTGYSGVGRTSFANKVLDEVRRTPSQDIQQGRSLGRLVVIRLNYKRAPDPLDLVYQLIRKTHDEFVNGDYVLDKRTQDRLRALNDSVRYLPAKETLEKAGEGKASATVLPVQSDIGARIARSKERQEREHSFDSLVAELNGLLTSIVQASRRTRPRLIDRMRGRIRIGTPLYIPYRIVIVIDEIDRLDLVKKLINLLTNPDVTFLLIGSKALHDNLRDLRANDEDQFGSFHEEYLPCIWDAGHAICEKLVNEEALPQGHRSFYDALREYLDFVGRGLPRRVLEELDRYSRKDGRDLHLEFKIPGDTRRIEFFAELQKTMEAKATNIWGPFFPKSVEPGKVDTARRGICHLLEEEILKKGQFQRQGVLDASSSTTLRIILPKAQLETMVDGL